MLVAGMTTGITGEAPLHVERIYDEGRGEEMFNAIPSQMHDTHFWEDFRG